MQHIQVDFDQDLIEVKGWSRWTRVDKKQF